jgi:hypothetical protein
MLQDIDYSSLIERACVFLNVCEMEQSHGTLICRWTSNFISSREGRLRRPITPSLPLLVGLAFTLNPPSLRHQCRSPNGFGRKNKRTNERKLGRILIPCKTTYFSWDTLPIGPIGAVSRCWEETMSSVQEPRRRYCGYERTKLPPPPAGGKQN